MSTLDGLTGARRSVAIACVLSAVVVVVLDAAIANVALPAIARSLAVPSAEAVRVVTAYQLALVMALLPMAALGESHGHRRVYAGGVALFTFASALCAVAPTLGWLLAARFLQGLGGAAILSLGVSLLRATVRSSELGAAIGWNALAVALGAALGPTIGALVLSVVGWPWLFAINLPLGLLVLFATRALPELEGSGSRIDLASVFPLDLLRSRSFRVSVAASITIFVGQSAAMIALPFHLQHGLGQGALRTGLLITPWPLTVMLVAPLAGRFTDRGRISGALLGAIGGALLATGFTLLALVSLPLVVPALVLCGAGFALFQVSNNRNMFLAAPRARSGAAGGLQGTARLTGQTLGASAMALLFTVGHGPRVGFALAAGMALTAGLVSMLRGD